MYLKVFPTLSGEIEYIASLGNYAWLLTPRQTMNPPIITGTTGTFNHKSRKDFLEDLPKKIRNTVRGVDLALINEAITVISEGNAIINGKAPNTRVETYIVIASYFKTARTPLHMFFDGALNVEDNYLVELKYKYQPYTIKFPETVVEN